MQEGPNGFVARWDESPDEKDARERHDLLPAFVEAQQKAQAELLRAEMARQEQLLASSR